MRTVNFKQYTVDNLSSSESQGQSGPEKGATKVFKHKQKSPWVPTLTGTFPNHQVDAGSWLGTKNALYYCALSANSFSWVLFMSSYTMASRHTCKGCSPSLFMPGKLSFSTHLIRNEGTTDELKKHFRCYQQEQFNLHEKVKKAIAWHGKTRSKKPHSLLYISLPCAK